MSTTYSLPTFGVSFGDVDTSYTVADVKAAVPVIAKYYSLIRTYDDFHSMDKYHALMSACEASGIDVLLGIPNDKLSGFDAKTYINDHAYKPSTGDGTAMPKPYTNLKCIIAGNETYNGSNYTNFAPLLAGVISDLTTEISGKSDLKNHLAVSCDFGPALYLTQNLADCDFTGLQNNRKSKYIVDAMTNILNSGLPTPAMVFGNLYPFYAPETSIDLNTPDKMINQLAGTSTGWYPYSAAMQALSKNGLSGLTLNVGETGWATSGGNASQCQTTSVDRLNMYLKAYKAYVETPGTYSGVEAFKGNTSIVFEMFDEPKKTTLPWEPYWGSYHSITPNSGTAPSIKKGVEIPFSPA